MPEIYTFNNNKENWKINASEITSISGDDLKFYANGNQNIVFNTDGTVIIDNHLDILNNVRTQNDIKLVKDLILDTSNVSIKTPNSNYVIKCGEDLVTKYINVSNQWIDLSGDGYKIDITPETKNSKVLLNFSVTYNISEIQNQKINFRLKRFDNYTNSTYIVVTDNILGTDFAFGIQDNYKFMYLDEPNTDTNITYYLEVSCNKLTNDISDTAILGYDDNKYNSIIAYQIYIPDISNTITKAAKKSIDVSFADKINNKGLFNNIDASKVSIDNSFSISETGTINNIIDVSSYIYSTTGTINLSGNIITVSNGIYNLGSESKRFKDVYVSNNSLYFGDNRVTVNESDKLQIMSKKSDNTEENVYINFDSIISEASFGNVELSNNLIMSNNTNIEFLSNIDLSVNEQLNILNDISINKTLISLADNIETIVYNNDLSINNINLNNSNNSNNLIINVSNIDISSIVTQDFINKNDISFNTVTIKQNLDISSLKITNLLNNGTITSNAITNLLTDLSVNTKIDISNGSITLNNNDINISNLKTTNLTTNDASINNLLSKTSLENANINNLIIKNKLNVKDVSCNEIETSGKFYVNKIELENDKLTIEASNVVIEGSLIVDGSTITIESNNIEISSNQIKLASNESTLLNESGIEISNNIASIKYTNNEIEISSNLFEVLKDISAQNITIQNNLNYLGSNLPKINTNISGTSTDLSLTLNELNSKNGTVLKLSTTHYLEKQNIYDAFDVSNLTDSSNINDISFIKNNNTYTISYNDLSFSDISRIFSNITTTGISLDIINNKVILSLPQSLEPNTNIEFSGVTISNSLYINQHDISIARVIDLRNKLQNMKIEGSTSSSSSQIISSSKFSVDLNFNNNDNKNKIITYEKNKNKYIKTSDIVVSSENNLHQNIYVYLNPFKATLQQRILSNIPGTTTSIGYTSPVDVTTLVETDAPPSPLSNFTAPMDVVISTDGTFALMCDLYNNCIYKIDLLNNNNVSILAGSGSSATGNTDAQGTSARFFYPHGIGISPDNSFVLVADHNNDLIRKVIIADGWVSTLPSNFDGLSLANPYNVAITPDGLTALVCDKNNNRIVSISLSNSNNSFTLAGSSSGYADGAGNSAKFNQPTGIAISPDGTFAVVADYYNHKIRKIEIPSGTVSTLAGSGSGYADGHGDSAAFMYPHGVAITPDGLNVLVADRYNHNIRAINIATRTVTTIAGLPPPQGLRTSPASATTAVGSSNGKGDAAGFNHPMGVAIDPSGNYALVADRYNHNIRKLTFSTTETLNDSDNNSYTNLLYSVDGINWLNNVAGHSNANSELDPLYHSIIKYEKNVWIYFNSISGDTSADHSIYNFSYDGKYWYTINDTTGLDGLSPTPENLETYRNIPKYTDVTYINKERQTLVTGQDVSNIKYPVISSNNDIIVMGFSSSDTLKSNIKLFYSYNAKNWYSAETISFESVSTNAIISNILWDGNKFIANIREHANIKYGYSYSGKEWYMNNNVSMNIYLSSNMVANNYSFRFDDNGSIGLNNQFNHTEDMTFSVWVKPNITNAHGRNLGYLIAGEGGISVNESSTVDTNSYPNLQSREIYLYDGVSANVNLFSGDAFVQDAIWQHLAFTFKNRTATGITVECFINGVSKGTCTTNGTQFTKTTYLGAWSSNQHRFRGDMDQIAMWDSALTFTQIQEIYNEGSGQDLTQFNPNLWYKCEEGTGDILYNSGSTGSANDGTLYNFHFTNDNKWVSNTFNTTLEIKTESTSNMVARLQNNRNIDTILSSGRIISKKEFVESTTSSYDKLTYSDDGYNWNEAIIKDKDNNEILDGSYGKIDNVAYNGNILVGTIGSSSSLDSSKNIIYSYTGSEWNMLDSLSGSSNLEWTGSMFTMMGNEFAYSYNGLQWFNNLDVTSSNVKANYGTLEYNNMVTQDIKSNINSKTSNNEIKISANQIIGIGQGSKFYYSNDIFNWYNLNGEDTSLNYLTNFKLNNINRNNISSNKVFDVSTAEYDTIIDNKLGLSYNGKMWLACGNTNDLSNTLAYSKDGYNWFNIGNNVSNILTRGYDITNNKKTWVAVGKKGTNGSIIYSNDGFSWCDVSNVSIQNSQQICSVVYGNDMFVAGAKGDKFILYYSRDAKNWTGIDISSIEGNSNIDSNYNSCTNLIYNGTSFVGLLQPENKLETMDKLTIIYSSDGYNWNAIVNTSIIPNDSSVNSLYSMDNNKDRVMVVGYRNILYSDNLIDWHQCLKVPINDNYKRFTDITWTGELWLLSTNYEVNNHRKLYYSKNGKVWNNINHGNVLRDTFIMKIGCTKSQSNIYLQHPIIAGCDGSTNTLIYSDDLYKWKGLGRVFSKECNDIKWNGNNWVAIGKNSSNNSEIKWSKDGIKWTNITFPSDISGLNSIACGKDSSLNDIMVIAGYKNNDLRILKSKDDGKTWNPKTVTSTTTSDIQVTNDLKIIYNNYNFILCADKIYKSTDLNNWETILDTSGRNILTTGNNLLFIDTINSNTLTKLDLYNYTNLYTEVLFDANNVECFGYNGEMFIVVKNTTENININSYRDMSSQSISNTDISGQASCIEWTGKKWLIGLANETQFNNYDISINANIHKRSEKFICSYDGINWEYLESANTFCSKSIKCIGTNSLIGTECYDSQIVINNNLNSNNLEIINNNKLFNTNNVLLSIS